MCREPRWCGAPSLPGMLRGWSCSPAVPAPVGFAEPCLAQPGQEPQRVQRPALLRGTRTHLC